MDSLLDNRSIVEIAEDQLKLSGLNINEHRGILNVTKTVIRGVFYQPSEPERTYCARLSRTYVILFIIRNTPEIINYFNTMSKHFILYVGSDLIIRAISEYYLPQSDQMAVNAFKILWQAGSKLILTEAMLEEVHSHIFASHLEYNNYYLDIDFFVDEVLASQSDRILIRAYYYSKLDQGNPNRPRTWTQYINNFLSSAKLFGATSTASMRSLRDTLCQRFGFEYEAQNEISSGVDTDELRTLANQIKSTRRSTKDERLSKNDALLILRIDSMRRSKENSSGNPYGYKTWYLTQDVVSGVAASKCFPKRRGNKYVMRPEFILNYIAYNPTNAQVHESLHTIFPSVLGIRLGSRLDAKTLENVLLKIREAYQVDSARASAIVAEHADALKSDRMRDFALKYGSRRGSSSA
jgi:hypothetical protein